MLSQKTPASRRIARALADAMWVNAHARAERHDMLHEHTHVCTLAKCWDNAHAHVQGPAHSCALMAMLCGDAAPASPGSSMLTSIHVMTVANVKAMHTEMQRARIPAAVA